jgi:hypothetical protein
MGCPVSVFHIIIIYFRTGVKLGALQTAFRYFDQKSLHPGCILASNGRIFSHTASTLPGDSGGPVLLFDPLKPPTFCGVRM